MSSHIESDRTDNAGSMHVPTPEASIASNWLEMQFEIKIARSQENL